MSTNATFLKIPKFGSHQRVKFIADEGVVKKLQHQSASWNYVIEIEMEMGIEPDFGRVGAETVVVLDEAEIDTV